MTKTNMVGNLISIVVPCYNEEEVIGETIKRLSFQKLLEVTEIAPMAQHVQEPRSNPYIFFKEEEVPGGFAHDEKAYRQRHMR